MCGIAGALISKNRSQDHIALATNMVTNIVRQQTSRGPDHQALEKIETTRHHLILGHNRLSIVDLSQAANQPMWDSTKRYCLIYNGMIYNYQEIRLKLIALGHVFNTQCDTEVVLYAFVEWGLKAFEQFNGMFAIVVFDCHEEKLYMARDRFGVKPLYYSNVNQQVSFASTSQVIAQYLKLQPNMQAIANGLASWAYDMQDVTVYNGLFSVSPGHVLTFSYNHGWQKNSHEYYSLHHRVDTLVPQLDQQPVNELLERTQLMLESAVQIRMRSDVQLAVALSGGIDSGTIAGIAKLHLPQLQAISFGSLQQANTEAFNARLSAAKIKVDVNFVFPSATEMAKAFWQTLDAQDAPFPNFSISSQYLLFEAAHQQGVKVMLGGQGADEIFMGYRKYQFFHLRKLLSEHKFKNVTTHLLQIMPQLAIDVLKKPQLWTHFQRYLKPSHNERWHRYKQSINLAFDRKQDLRARQFQDLNRLSLPALLRYEDRNSMANSIETRLPFLDYRIVEFALALPVKVKLHKGYTKWILREISSNYLPREISHNRIKRGFDVSTAMWIKAGVGQQLRDSLQTNTPLLRSMGITNTVGKLFSDHLLIKNPQRLAEAISLAWLASKHHFDWG